jgi:hypothetical protein
MDSQLSTVNAYPVVVANQEFKNWDSLMAFLSEKVLDVRLTHVLDFETIRKYLEILGEVEDILEGFTGTLIGLSHETIIEQPGRFKLVFSINSFFVVKFFLCHVA